MELVWNSRITAEIWIHWHWCWNCIHHRMCGVNWIVCYISTTPTITDFCFFISELFWLHIFLWNTFCVLILQWIWIDNTIALWMTLIEPQTADLWPSLPLSIWHYNCISPLYTHMYDLENRYIMIEHLEWMHFSDAFFVNFFFVGYFCSLFFSDNKSHCVLFCYDDGQFGF